MLLNNLLAMIVDVVISLIMVVSMNEGCRAYSTTQRLVVFITIGIIELLSYTYAGYRFPNKKSCIRNYLSVCLPSLFFFILWTIATIWEGYMGDLAVLGLIPGIPFLYTIGEFTEAFGPSNNIRNYCLGISIILIPSLFIGLGMELKRKHIFSIQRQIEDCPK